MCRPIWTRYFCRRPLVAVVAAGLFGSLACHSEPSGVAGNDDAPAAPLPVTALQVPPDRLSRLEITRPGRQPVALESSGDRWRTVSPVSFPANQTAVDAMTAVLAEIEIQRRVADSPEPKHWLGEHAGVVVKAWTTDGQLHQFTVGASAGGETYVQRPGDPHVYAVQGRCRRVFETSFDELRHPVVTTLDLAHIERIVYDNRAGVLDLVADSSQPGRFVETAPAIRNFNSDRASKNVAVLAGLRAKGFVDPPVERAATGLFDTHTATASVSIRGRQQPLTIWIGARTDDRRVHVRTSDTDQIFLVSAHLMSSLVPERRHFERSDAQMRQLRAHASARDARPENTGPAVPAASATPGPEHTHGRAPPTQVPPALLRELRALALE